LTAPACARSPGAPCSSRSTSVASRTPRVPPVWDSALPRRIPGRARVQVWITAPASTPTLPSTIPPKASRGYLKMRSAICA
jgi:hypothetical protein